MKTIAQELREHRDAMLRARQARLAGVQGFAGGRVGSAAPNRLSRRSFSDKPQPMPEPARGSEMIPFDQSGAVAVAESNNYPVRYGGRPFLVVTLKVALTTAAEITLARNGSVFATEALAISDPVQTFAYEDTDSFAVLDLARFAITNAGAGGSGLHAELWFE